MRRLLQGKISWWRLPKKNSDEARETGKVAMLRRSDTNSCASCVWMTEMSRGEVRDDERKLEHLLIVLSIWGNKPRKY